MRRGKGAPARTPMRGGWCVQVGRPPPSSPAPPPPTRPGTRRTRTLRSPPAPGTHTLARQGGGPPHPTRRSPPVFAHPCRCTTARPSGRHRGACTLQMPSMPALITCEEVHANMIPRRCQHTCRTRTTQPQPPGQNSVRALPRRVSVRGVRADGTPVAVHSRRPRPKIVSDMQVQRRQQLDTLDRRGVRHQPGARLMRHLFRSASKSDAPLITLEQS